MSPKMDLLLLPLLTASSIAVGILMPIVHAYTQNRQSATDSPPCLMLKTGYPPAPDVMKIRRSKRTLQTDKNK